MGANAPLARARAARAPPVRQVARHRARVDLYVLAGQRRVGRALLRLGLPRCVERRGARRR
eukprot:1725423-Pyramimonas_sp.AAC.1